MAAQALARLLPVLLLAALLGLSAGQTSPTVGSACATGSTWCSIAYTTGTTVTGTSPKYLGVNLGHKHTADTTWTAFVDYLGINGAWPRHTPATATGGTGPGPPV